MTEEGRDNLRLLPVARDDERILAKKERTGYCRHRRGLLDEAACRLYCRECGEEVDPFAFLLGLANERDHWRREGETIRAQYEKAARELAEIERLRKNAKARLRKTGVELSVPTARAARRQLRALALALPNVVRDSLPRDSDDGDAEAIRKAEETARLCGYRKDEAERALAALTEALEAAGVRPQD